MFSTVGVDGDVYHINNVMITNYYYSLITRLSVAYSSQFATRRNWLLLHYRLWSLDVFIWIVCMPIASCLHGRGTWVVLGFLNWAIFSSGTHTEIPLDTVSLQFLNQAQHSVCCIGDAVQPQSHTHMSGCPRVPCSQCQCLIFSPMSCPTSDVSLSSQSFGMLAGVLNVPIIPCYP